MSLKILYAVQATGNGHISRAMTLMPYLEQYGKVDVFLSGSNSHLAAQLPVAYRSEGLSLFYGRTGGLDYRRMWKELNVKRVWQEAKALPVERYDIILNDFESITSLACSMKKVKSIGFGHQASFQSKHTPRHQGFDPIGEWVLRNYAPASAYFGLHFQSYDSFIYSPILKQEIVTADPINQGHITVYLSHYSDEVVIQALQQIRDIRFELFSKKVKVPTRLGHITLIPISNEGFTRSLIGCQGVITGAGFETPAEALYLGKQVLCLPIRGQYEQLCNAAALRAFGVTIIPKLNHNMEQHIREWLNNAKTKPLTLAQSTYDIVQQVIEKGRSIQPLQEEKGLLTEEDLLALF
jgi:uncharacterized protein (TIGR00661 family)